MELSAKISKSIYLYLENRGEVAGEFLEEAGLLTHVALDPERWISAQKVENFLDILVKKYDGFYPKEIALNAVELRGWGLLDQVLRILPTATEIYENPKQFLSYFISPSVELNWIEKKEKVSCFKTNLSTDEYPLVTDYLSGALEVVTEFIGDEQSQVSWISNTISIDWSKKQGSIFQEGIPKNYKPEVYKEAVAIIQQQQHELHTFKNKLNNVDFEVQESLVEDLKVLEDYFLRARQLVSLLKADSGSKKWFKEAVKRLNWDELQGLHINKIKEVKEKILNQKSVDKTESKDSQYDFLI